MRTRLHTDERRAQLVELGLRLFGERSYDDVSIDDIAMEAGVSKGLLYHYFGGKRDFYVACVQAAAEALLDAVEPSDELTPEQNLAVGLNAYLDFVDERAESYTALMRGGLGADEDVLAIIDGARHAIIDRTLTRMGFDEPRPAFRVATRSWIGAVEAASLDWLEHRDMARENLIRLLMASLYAHVKVASLVDPNTGAEPNDLAGLALLGLQPVDS